MLIGAVIGYITNYLAIRMLFRPTTAKYLFGKQLPFTPGVIPKERDRLAKQTGQTVKQYLLTEDAVLSHLQTAQVSSRIEAGVQQFLMNLKQNDKTVGNYLDAIGTPNADALAKAVADQLIFAQFYGWADQTTATVRLEKMLRAVPMDTKAQLLHSLSEHIQQGMTAFLADDDRPEQLADLIREKLAANADNTLENVLPESALMTMLAAYNQHEDKLVHVIKQALLSTQAMAGIREAIAVTADKHMTGPLRLVLRPHALAAKAVTSLESYLHSPESDQLLAQNLRQLVERTLSTTVGEATQHLPTEDLSTRMAELLQGAILFLNTDGMQQKVDQFIENHQTTIEEKTVSGLGALIAGQLQQQTATGLKQTLVPIIVRLREVPVKTAAQPLDENVIARIAKKASALTEQAMPKAVHFIVHRFEADRLVEDQIKRFDIMMLERIVLEVASKELQAITNLGALLGAIMGLIQPLIIRLL